MDASTRLLETQEQLQLLIEHTPASVALFDREMRYLAVSRRFVTDLRVDGRDLIGRSHYDVFPEISPHWRAIHQRCLAGAVERCEEEAFPRADGTVDWVRWEIRPWRNADGAVGGVVLFSEILTAKKQAERALDESEVGLRTAFAVAPVGINQVDLTSGRMLQVNQRLCTITGYSQEELLGMHVSHLTHPDDRHLDAAVFRALLDQGQSEYRLEKRYVRKDGGVRWVSINVALLGDRGQRPRSMAMIEDITERRAAEAERRLQATALQAAANGIVITDRAGRIQWVNAAFCKLTGYSAEEALGGDTRILRSGVQPPPFYRALWDTILAGQVWQGELTNRRKDGSLYEESMTITPVLDDSGALTHFIAIKRDVSERKRAAEAIASAEEQHRLALDAVELGTFRADLVEDVLHFDERARGHLGLDHGEITVRELERHLHADDLAAARTQLGAAVAAGRTHIELSFRVLLPSGQLRWLALHARIRCEGEGAARRAVRAIGTTQDITPARRAEEELRASEQRYRGVVDRLEDVVFIADTEQRITFVNGAVARFGYRPEQVVGRRLDEFIHPEDLEKVKDARVLGLNTAFEYRLLDARGQPRYVRSTRQPLLEGTRPIGTTGVIIDLTRQRETEEQLRAAQKMDAIGRLAGGVAHDFNNLLSVILSYTELSMSDMPEDNEQRADLEQVLQAGKRAQTLTRQLLAFSRKQMLRPEPIDLDELVAGVGNMLKRLIGEDVELHLVMAHDPHVTRADRGQIEQLLMNLAVNARDAMPHGGRLTLTLSHQELQGARAAALELKPGPYVELCVADTGCGMDEATRARIFEPFFTTKDVGKGTGLGLSMVYGIIKQSGGGIAVESTPGQGSSFRVYLPRYSGDAGASDRARAQQAPPPKAQGNETILVVEDEAALRNVVRRILVGAGYQVLLAANGAEALATFEQGKSVDLLLTDVVMPGMNGRELVERLRQQRPELRVVYTSGYTNEVIAHEGARFFLPKPYDWRTLTRMVRSALDAR